MIKTSYIIQLNLYFIAIFLTTGTARTEEHAKEIYLGVASCASSACHGGTAPRNSRNVFQNEYNIWFRHDAHSKAYTTLLSEDSRVIGKHLGIEHPEKDATCLSCHSTQVPEDSQGPKFRTSDGVGCESCHGPASSYIKSHTELNRSYQDNLEDGLYDLVSLTKRAKLCLTCHQGNDDKFVNHRLIGAGHPRLRFELDTYGILQPHHWRKDEVYNKRKHTYEPARAWLTGQVLHAREAVNSVNSSVRATQPGLPEFTDYYCYSCHHSLKDEQWKKREYQGRPGELTRNTASLQMVYIALEKLDQDLAQKLKQFIHIYKNPFYLDDKNEKNLNITTLIDDEILPLFEKVELNRNMTRLLLESVVTYGNEHLFPPYEVAEQYAMAVSALVSELDPRGTLYKKQLDILYQSLKDEKEFDPEGFTNAMKVFKDYLKKPHG